MEHISEEKLVATFDQLVSEGVIVYGPHTKYDTQDEGYPVSTLISIEVVPRFDSS